MLLHTIGCSDGPNHPNPWLNRYIFPGGYLPALSEILPAIEKAGLIVTDVEVLRLHYAKTLAGLARALHGAPGGGRAL
jgi:cyclopropane-fatty-acyl-phospholipid synthase